MKEQHEKRGWTFIRGTELYENSTHPEWAVNTLYYYKAKKDDVILETDFYTDAKAAQEDICNKVQEHESHQNDV